MPRRSTGDWEDKTKLAGEVTREKRPATAVGVLLLSRSSRMCNATNQLRACHSCRGRASIILSISLYTRPHPVAKCWAASCKSYNISLLPVTFCILVHCQVLKGGRFLNIAITSGVSGGGDHSENTPAKLAFSTVCGGVGGWENSFKKIEKS